MVKRTKCEFCPEDCIVRGGIGLECEQKPETATATGSIVYLSTIHVMSYSERMLAGTIYNPYFGVQTFGNTMELLCLMETQMDKLDCPHHYMRYYRFSQNVENRSMDFCWRPLLGRRSVATFQIRVAFRRNASWQGTISCPSKHMERNFRSVQELLILMDNVLSVQDVCPDSIHGKKKREKVKGKKE